jgi:hypothetical protein
MPSSETKQQINPWMVIAIAVVGYLLLTRNAPNPPGPNPIDPVAPLKVDAQLVEGSRLAVKALVESMAADMDTTAKEVADGQSKTVSEVATANAKRDTDIREAFKKSMAELLKSRLGAGDLKAGSESVFRDVASGFKKAVK